MSKTFAHSPWTASPTPSFTQRQKSWLMRPGALTDGLRALGTLELRVLREFTAGLSRDEAHRLNLPINSPVWVREIVMHIDQEACVIARSLTPLEASHGVWQSMRRLRSRPLADILYHDRSITRSAFEVARVNRFIPIYKTNRDGIKHAVNMRTAQCLLARRSVFWKASYPLLVSECFLPAFWRKTDTHI